MPQPHDFDLISLIMPDAPDAVTDIPSTEELEALAPDEFEERIAELVEKFETPYIDAHKPRDVRDEYRRGVFKRGDRKSIGVKLEWTATPFGGKASRPWFGCPGCGYRCALLFKGRCRRCEDVTYRSTTDPELAALRARSMKLRSTLRDRGSLLSAPPSRPIRMTLSRYSVLMAELEAVELEALKQLAPDIPAMQHRQAVRFQNAREWEALRLRRRIPRQRRA